MRGQSSSLHTNISFSAVKAQDGGAQFSVLSRNPSLPFQHVLLLSQSAIRTLGGFIFGEHQVLSGLCCHIPWFSFCFNSWVHPQGVLHSDAQTEPCEMLGFALLEHLHQNERTQQQSVRLKFSLCQRCGTNDLDISLRSASFTPWQSQGQSTAQEFVTFQWCEKFVNPSRGNSSWTITNLLPWVHDKCHRLLKFAFSNSASQPRAKFKKKKSWKSWVCYFEIICNGFAALQDLFSFKWNLTFTSYQNLGCTQPEQEKLQPSNHLQDSKLELFMRKNVIFHFHIFN